MQQDKLNHSNIERIIYSKQFRCLQDKTQLFYPSQKQRVRTRLTHTLEVRTIAHKIACSLNNKIEVYNANANNTPLFPADLELIDAIAFAHDIGHTPFGHIGERTIDAVVSGKDSLGGMIPNRNKPTMRFKHNSNSMRILVERGVSDWRITEGALSHTRIYYKGDKTCYSVDPYHPFANSTYRKLTNFFFDQKNLNYRIEDKSNPPSLTLEGQIVAISDEIAQRAADLGDAKIESRYLDKIQSMFQNHIDVDKCPKFLKDDPFARLEWVIFNAMTNDVAEEAFRKLKKLTPTMIRYNGITHAVYSEKIADFSADVKVGDVTIRSGIGTINDELDKFVGTFLAQSEEVRESDSRSKYIIRQLYKAYLNDVSLLPDDFLENHLETVSGTDAFKDIFGCPDFEPDPGDTSNSAKLRNHKWYADSKIIPKKGKKLLDMGVVKYYFDILRHNNREEPCNRHQDISWLFDAFLLNVGFHIAGMTNTEAFDSYNKIYGHTL